MSTYFEMVEIKAHDVGIQKIDISQDFPYMYIILNEIPLVKGGVALGRVGRQVSMKKLTFDIHLDVNGIYHTQTSFIRLFIMRELTTMNRDGITDISPDITQIFPNATCVAHQMMESFPRYEMLWDRLISYPAEGCLVTVPSFHGVINLDGLISSYYRDIDEWSLSTNAIWFGGLCEDYYSEDSCVTADIISRLEYTDC